LKLKQHNSFFSSERKSESYQINLISGFYDETIERYGHSISCEDGRSSPQIFLLNSITLIERRSQISSNDRRADLTLPDPTDIGKWGENSHTRVTLFEMKAVNEI
jgi:hypothetical protein